MRAVATHGRWIWGASGLVTTAVLVVPGIHLIASAGQPDQAQPQATATRTVTVPQPVTSVTVQSYGGPVQVTAGPVRHVQITEVIMYDQQAGGPNTVVQAVPGGPSALSPRAKPAYGGPAAVRPRGRSRRPAAPPAVRLRWRSRCPAAASTWLPSRVPAPTAASASR